MGQSEYIAALDLGSSKIIAMVGSKNEQGILSVTASEKTESGTCIRRGCVHNVEETSLKIRTLVNLLNRRVSPSIDKFYIGIGGQSLRTETYTVTKEVNGSIVSEIIINSLLQECKDYQPEFAEVLDIVSPEYYLDGRLEANPKGIQCSRIEARFKLILGHPLLKKTIHKAVTEKSGIHIAGYIVSPIATANAVLKESEKELGCALVEFGAGITYLSIYKNNLLKYMVAIPLGGNVITKDICDLNLIEKDAEEIKINFGSALVEFDKDAKVETARLAEGSDKSREIKLNTLNNIIEARVDEIVANVIEQIHQSGYFNMIGAGIIITGGGALLKNMDEFIRNKTDKEVRIATTKKTLVNHSPDWALDSSNSEIIGLLATGTQNCAKVIVEREETTPQTSLFGKDEIEIVNPQKDTKKAGDQHKKLNENVTPKEKQKGGFFNKITKKFDGISKSLFDDDEKENE